MQSYTVTFQGDPSQCLPWKSSNASSTFVYDEWGQSEHPLVTI